jgi:hypothetical protein
LALLALFEREDRATALVLAPVVRVEWDLEAVH